MESVEIKECIPEVAKAFFIECEDLIEKEAENIASNSAALVPLQNAEITLRIQ